jgi:hypothetical protein
VHLAKLLELHTQPVTQRAFGPQFVEQRFGFVESFGRNVTAFEQVAKAALNL